MEFLMDFEKTSISTKVGKFLQENLKNEKDKESLQNVITEKALLKNDAINLLITILQAIIINGDVGKDNDSEVPVLNDTVIEIEIETENDNDSEKKLVQTTSAAAILENKKAEKKKAQDKINNKKELCRFFKNGRCKKGN